MGDFRRTAFRRKPRSGGSDEQPEEETGEFSWTSEVQVEHCVTPCWDRQDYSQWSPLLSVYNLKIDTRFVLWPHTPPGHTCDHEPDFANMEYPLGFSPGSSNLQWNLLVLCIQLCRQVSTGHGLLFCTLLHSCSCKYIRLQLHCYALHSVVEDTPENPSCDFVDHSALF